jgi:urease accessory protein
MGLDSAPTGSDTISSAVANRGDATEIVSDPIGSEAAADGASDREIPASRGWDARLALGFARRGEQTVLARRTHRGPLVVQKALHPEGPGVCQAIVVHPPGGIAGGDRLALALDVDVRAHAQLTTPGAAKWYRTTGAPACQSLAARVGAGATLEWLPQEAIVFDGARAEVATVVTLAADATFLGWDIVCLGRTASGETFRHGSYRQRFDLVRDGALIWAERIALTGGSRLASSLVGLNGCPMFGTFVVAATAIPDDVIAAWRRIVPVNAAATEGAVTQLPGVLVARCRGHSAEAARQWFAALWTVARPALCGRAAVPPRIWTT